MAHRVAPILGGMLSSLMIVCLTCAGSAQEKKNDANEGKKGKALGTLTAKSENSIEVKADGEEKARRYVPRWIGGAPANGGGPEKALLKVFKGLKVGSRVEVQWVFEERLRALSVKTLAPPRNNDAK